MGLGHLGLAGLPLGLDGLQHHLELGTVPGSALVHLVYPSLRKLARLFKGTLIFKYTLPASQAVPCAVGPNTLTWYKTG